VWLPGLNPALVFPARLGCLVQAISLSGDRSHFQTPVTRLSAPITGAAAM
jgi:hypothetical protein